MVGISPTITNSVVPMAKALMVSANRANGITANSSSFRFSNRRLLRVEISSVRIIDGAEFARIIFAEK
jgi:hypothetical protein